MGLFAGYDCLLHGHGSQRLDHLSCGRAPHLHHAAFGSEREPAAVGVEGDAEDGGGDIGDGDFPLTGYPAMDVAAWKKIIQTCKDYGLNGFRFHSWCPPEAAFQAADELGLPDAL